MMVQIGMIRRLSGAAALAVLVALPASAQTRPPATATLSPAAPVVPAPAVPPMTAAAAVGTNRSFITADNHMRASKIIGANVYNEQKQKIGTVDELLMGNGHDVTNAVLSVGGFLGIDSKLVQIPIDQLQIRDNELVINGATKDQLKTMPTYAYAR